MPENFEPQQYRDDLAKELEETPKEERRKALKEAKGNLEYWEARTEKIKERQEEEEIDDGLGVLVKKKILYHGSNVPGIKNKQDKDKAKFREAEESTIGTGVYLTSEAKDAIGYARARSNDGRTGDTIVYESSIENMRLCDLRKNENVKSILEGFKHVLLNELKNPDLKWNRRGALEKNLDAIQQGKVDASNLRDATDHCSRMFSEYVKSLGGEGYDGLIAFEGGEAPAGGESLGNHDSILIFEPKKVKINQEHNINIE